MIEVRELPWPPSVNAVYRRAKHGVTLSDRARTYRYEVLEKVMRDRVPRERVTYRLAVMIHAHPPADSRKHDLDNIQKAVLDGLQHAGVYADDSQIDDLWTIRLAPVKGGSVSVFIREAG